MHEDVSAEIVAMQTELGLSPSGSYSTVTARFNDILRSEVRLRRAAAQSISNALTTQVSWDTEDADADGWITTPSGNLSVPAGFGGRCVFTANFLYSSAALNSNYVQMTIAGTTFIGPGVAGNVVPTQTLTVARRVAATEVISVSTFHANGSALNMTGSLSIFWLGP